MKTIASIPQSQDVNGGRLQSLDALRGFDMLFIMGLATLVVKLCVWLGWGETCWLAQQMEHVDWHGLAHHDTIFPLFLFIAGISFPFSFAKQRERGLSLLSIRLRCLRRGVLLFLLGLVYGGFLRDFGALRLSSVLARIGLAWMLAALAYTALHVRGRMVMSVILLVGYWILTFMWGAPDHPAASCLTPEGNLSCWIDRTFLFLKKGQLYDNQTTLGLFPAVVTAWLGMFAGDIVRNPCWSGNRKSVLLLISAVVSLGVGLLIAKCFGSYSFPINKKLWSPSFVLVVGSYSFAIFALFYWLIDVKRCWRRTLFFRVIGLNSITIYLAQPILGFSSINRFFFGGLAGCLPSAAGAVLQGATYVALCWVFLYFLYRKNVFLKV